MIAVVVIAIVMPAMTWAQEEGHTLEGLAEQVTGLVERVEMLERLYSPDAVMDGEGSCQIAIGMGGLFGGTRGGMHPTTVAAYMAISENQVPAAIGIGSVRYTSEGEIALTFGMSTPLKANVTEYWIGCEFQSHSRFWEEDFSGNVTYLD
jgi:hypothetical protein